MCDYAWASVEDRVPADETVVWVEDAVEGIVQGYLRNGQWMALHPGGLEGDTLYHVTRWWPWLVPDPIEAPIDIIVRIYKRPWWKVLLRLPRTWHGHYKIMRRCGASRLVALCGAWVLARTLLIVGKEK